MTEKVAKRQVLINIGPWMPETEELQAALRDNNGVDLKLATLVRQCFRTGLNEMRDRQGLEALSDE